MSGIAKGKILILEEDLKKWLGLPDDTEIISALHLGEGIELKVASKEPNGVTHSVKGWSSVKMVALPDGKGVVNGVAVHGLIDDSEISVTGDAFSCPLR